MISLAEENNIVHLMVERGPDKGRRITVPDAGARIGRSSQNDIELTDPSISRFQCRVFFKPDELLWIADLGSTNETLVNAKPVLESKLNVGDQIEIGETIIRVVSDNLKGVITAPPLPPAQGTVQPAYAPPAAFTPVSFDKPAAQPEVPAAPKIDLGLSKAPGSPMDETPGSSGGAKKMLWLLLVAMLAIATVAVMKSGLLKPGSGSQATQKVDDTFSIYYEKVNGSVSNIFRYALTLERGKLSVQIDSLTENRHVTRDKQVAKDILAKLRNDLEGGGFLKLDENYQGLQPNVYDAADMEIILGSRSRRCVVVNRIEPDDFKQTRDMIEEFAKNELGLITMSLSPDKLISLARDACLQGQKLYGEREVKYENLWDSIRAFQEAQLYLETIEPKPDFYQTVISGIAESKKELNEQFNSYQFLADKSIKMNDWKTAADNLQIIEQLIPDRNDPRNADADKKLVDVQRRIKR